MLRKTSRFSSGAKRYVQEQERAETVRQLASERQRVTRLRLELVGLCLLLMVLVALAIFAFQQRNAATRAQAEADAQRAEAERQLDLAQQASDAADAAAREEG